MAAVENASKFPYPPFYHPMMFGADHKLWNNPQLNISR
jgi:hypothetical protein